MPHGGSKAMPHGSSKAMPQGGSKAMPQGGSKAMPQGSSKAMPQGVKTGCLLQVRELGQRCEELQATEGSERRAHQETLRTLTARLQHATQELDRWVTARYAR